MKFILLSLLLIVILEKPCLFPFHEERLPLILFSQATSQNNTNPDDPVTFTLGGDEGTTTEEDASTATSTPSPSEDIRCPRSGSFGDLTAMDTVTSTGDIEAQRCIRRRRIPGDEEACVAEDTAEEGTCYALVLAGGGNKGSYQAGVIKGLVEQFRKSGRKVRWDVVSGVSVGSLNAYSSLFFKPGDEEQWADRLTNLWKEEVKQSDVSSCEMPLKKNWMKWSRKFLRLGSKKNKPDSLCNNKPLGEFASRIFKGQTPNKQRGIAISAQRLNDAKYVTFTEKRSPESLIRAVLASSALPVFFPPVEVDEGSGLFYADGGVLENANVAAAVRHCMDRKGVPSSRVVVDYIDCSPQQRNFVKIEPKKMGIAKLALRALSLTRADSSGANCLRKARGKYPDFKTRYFVQPQKKSWEILYAASENLLDMTNKKLIDRMVEEGEKDGRQAQCFSSPSTLP